MTDSGTPPAAGPAARSVPRWAGIAIALAVLAAAYLWRLDRPLLWADEAQTGIGARSVLHAGYPSAFDGRNAAVIDNGRTLDTQLSFKQIPWLSFYVGAASMALFGDDTAGLRALFALLGVLAVFPLRALLAGRTRQPCLLATLLLLAPQTVLFQRNARYYPLLILLFTTLLWHLTADIRRRGLRLALGLAIFVLLFHSHVGVALGCSGAALLFCALRRRELLLPQIVAVGAGLLSWLVWYRQLGPSLGTPSTNLSLLPEHFGLWLAAFGQGLLAALRDFDLVGALPLPLWAGLVAWLAWRGRPALRALLGDPLVLLIVLGLAVQFVATAAVFGVETGLGYSLLRYHAHLVPAAMLLGVLLLEAAVQRPWPRAALLAVWLGSNLLSLSYWRPPEWTAVPASWIPPVAGELARPPAEAWDEAFGILRARSAPGGDEVVQAMPPWTQEVVLFHVGDRVIVPPYFTPDGGAAVAGLQRAVGEPAWSHLIAKPMWIVDSLDVYGVVPEGYELAATIASSRSRPDDGTRPELTRHAFPTEGQAGRVRLFRLRR